MLNLLAIPFPNINPVALSLGPIEIRWYGIAYAVGLLLGWLYVRRLLATPSLWAPGHKAFPDDLAADLLLYAALGVVVGGRLGDVLLYEPVYFWQHPAEVPQIWRGGMAFHGGLIGTGLALFVLSRVRKVSALTLIDLTAAATPIGLLLGRLANFVNGELWGHVSDVPWAMVFPDGGPLPRHPSQIYEALTEGALLFLVLWYAIYLRHALRQPGTVTGLFLLGYGIARIVCEHFREDTDPQIGLGLFTSGQIYSIPMVLAGIALVIWAQRRGVRPSGSDTIAPTSAA
jgi:phosphatidylglycerol:prolipoprotein diacylglycerol transferase